MSSLIRWQPFNDLISLRDAMERLFEESFIRPSSQLPGPLGVGDVTLDIYETQDDVVVKTAIPGVKSEDLDITIAGDTLSIRGETKIEEEVKLESYIRQERRYGAFSRSVELPSGLDTDNAEATFENGVLTLRVPKLEEVKPKTVRVEAKTAK